MLRSPPQHNNPLGFRTARSKGGKGESGCSPNCGRCQLKFCHREGIDATRGSSGVFEKTLRIDGGHAAEPS